MADTTGARPEGEAILTTSAPTATPVAYVAEGQIPPAPPPPGEVGLRHWIRENLFSDWINTTLTVLSVLALVWLIPSFLDWAVFKAVVSASTLNECRDIMDESFGEGVRGACWAMIAERFHQFMYGFYPDDLYWRPTLAFGLLFVALAPVLFARFPGRRPLFVFTLAYPAVAYYLIWGGSVWPFAALVVGGAFAVAVLVAVLRVDHPVIGTPGVAVLAAVAVFALYMNVAQGPVAATLEGLAGPLGPRVVESGDLGGFLLTLIIGVTAISVSLPIGIALALGRQSGLVFFRLVSITVIETVRGVPLITLLFIASTVLNYFFPPNTFIDIVLRVIIVGTLFSAAYVAEAVRGGLAALPRGQYEAGDSLGLTYWQSMRLVILPQALKIAIPSIVNIFIGLFKDTTLVSIIGLLDPLGIIRPITEDPAWKGIYAEPLLFVALFFFLCCFGMSRYSMYLERRLKTDRS